MNINVMRCIKVQKTNIVKEIQLGNTKIKFCKDCIAEEKEKREKAIKDFKQASIKLMTKD